MERTEGTDGRLLHSSRLPSIVGMIAVVYAIALIPLQVVSLGYLPSDDAKGHAAMVVSGRPFQEILVLRDDIRMDWHPGWQFILDRVHRFTACDIRALVVYPVVALFATFALVPLWLARRPESWALSLLVLSAAYPDSMTRLFSGRPLVVSMVFTVVVCFLWRRLSDDRRPLAAMTAVAVLAAASTWMYSAWYLLVLPIAAFVAARQWRGALRLTACIVLGVLVGALFTGTPLLLLASAVEHVHRVFTGPVPRISLVGELQPLREGWPLALVALAILISRRMRAQSNLVLLRSPPLLLALISCALGLHVSRFWDDWGVPALAAWMTTEFDDLLALKMDGASWRRTGFAIIVACVLYMDVTSDSEGRWSDGSTAWDLSPVMDNCPEWLPEPSGILYSYDMRLFYDTFFRYPHGWWRYSLGFEPTMMPEDNLRVYADIMATRCSYASFAPWVRKMTPADRLVLTKHPPRTPGIPQLEWRCFGADLCIGRLPRREGAEAQSLRCVD